MCQDPLLPRLYQISRVRRETHDVYMLDLEPADGSPVPEFSPGQFNMLYVFGIGEVPISISGGPTRDGSVVHTVRAVGAVSRAICALRKGAMLGLRGPFGSHWPVQESQGDDILLVAGGIGLAPLRPALLSILAQRERFGKVILLYGARTPADVLYSRELSRWARAGVDVRVTVDRGAESWKGNVGVVTSLIPRLTFDRLNTAAMICGPEIMMRFTIGELSKLDITDERIYVSMERNMKCGIGLCGHCQYGPSFICKDGPVFAFSRVKSLFGVKEA